MTRQSSFQGFPSTALLSLLLTCFFDGSTTVLGGDLPPVEPGFTRIFNGKNLEGWKVAGGGKKESWIVKDGVLHASPGGNWLAYKKSYGDFILRLDWKMSRGANSGIFFRVPTTGDGSSPYGGFEAQITNNSRKPEHCTGALYGIIPISTDPKKWYKKQEAADVWHSYEIFCVGKRIVVRVDNVECVNASYDDNKEEMKKRPLEGLIGFQDAHAGGETTNQFRNIRISELNADGLSAGFKRILTPGKETGWHKIKTVHGTGGSWKMVDGAWVGEQDPPGSGNGGVMVSDGRYDNFELIIETFPDWGPCSGIFLRSTESGQCYQNMVDHHGGGNIGSIYGEGSGGFENRNYEIDDAKEAYLKKEFQNNIPFPIDPANWHRRWNYDGYNEIRARMVGNPPSIDVWLNGVHVTRFKDTEIRKMLDEDGKGPNGIQVHRGKGWPKGTKVRFRNIQIRELS